MAELSRCNSTSSMVENSDCESGLPSPHYLSGLNMLMSAKAKEGIQGNEESPVIPHSGIMKKILMKMTDFADNHSVEKEYQNVTPLGTGAEDLKMQQTLDQTEAEPEDDCNKTCSDISEILCTIPSALIKRKLQDRFDRRETDLPDNRGFDEGQSVQSSTLSRPCPNNNFGVYENIQSQETQDVMYLSEKSRKRYAEEILPSDTQFMVINEMASTHLPSTKPEHGSSKKINDLGSCEVITFGAGSEISQETRETTASCNTDKNDSSKNEELKASQPEMEQFLSSSASQDVLPIDKTKVSTRTKTADQTQDLLLSVDNKEKNTDISKANSDRAKSDKTEIAERKEKQLKRHEHELSVIRRACKQLDCGEGILMSDNTQKAADAVQKTLLTLQSILSSLSTCHKYERSTLAEKLKERHSVKEDKLLLKQQGQLLQERQRQLLLLFRKHKSLSEKLKTFSSSKDSRKSSQTEKTCSGNSVTTISSQPVCNESKRESENLDIAGDAEDKSPENLTEVVPVEEGVSVVTTSEINCTKQEPKETLLQQHSMPTSKVTCLTSKVSADLLSKDMGAANKSSTLPIAASPQASCFGQSAIQTPTSTSVPLTHTQGTSQTKKDVVPVKVSGKRPMPKQVAEINILMSPNSSLDFSVANSPSKNNRQSFKAPIKKMSSHPIPILPRVLTQKCDPVNKPIPIKRVCRPIDCQPQNSRQPKDLPELKELVSEGVLKSGPHVLSLYTGTKNVFASLTEAGYIQSTGGEMFRSPMQWCAALLSTIGARNWVKKPLAYDKVLYNGIPLSSFKLPSVVKQSNAMTYTVNREIPEKQNDTSGKRLAHQQATPISSDQMLLQDKLKQCSVRILSDFELIPNIPSLPDDFWSVHISARQLPTDIVDCIDCW